jgi:hypothetical protein
MLARVYATTDSLLWHTRGIPRGYSREGSLSNRASINGRSDSSDGIVGNMKMDNDGGGDNYLSRMR